MVGLNLQNNDTADALAFFRGQNKEVPAPGLTEFALIFPSKAGRLRRMETYSEQGMHVYMR